MPRRSGNGLSGRGRAGRSRALDPRGEAVLARADVVVYDHLASARLLDLAPADACGSARASRSAIAR